jgi:hypothetical protein
MLQGTAGHTAVRLPCSTLHYTVLRNSLCTLCQQVTRRLVKQQHCYSL